MMTPPDKDPNEPYPGLGAALLLTVMGLVAAVFTSVALSGIGMLAAIGVGSAIGLGAVASIGAQNVGEPQADRLGLRRLDLEAIPILLCLVPAILLSFELDNLAGDFAGDEPALLPTLEAPARNNVEDFEAVDSYDTYEVEAYEDPPASVEDGYDGAPARADELAPFTIDYGDPATFFQALIVMVGITPLVNCFLFFGVIQQGLVRRRGLLQGVLFASLFWMLLREVPVSGMTRFVVGTLATLGLGSLLGLARIATGSILAPMLVATGWAAIDFLRRAAEGRMDLPGLNVEGTHVPLVITFASTVVVGWAASTIYREADRRFSGRVGGESDDLEPPIDLFR